VDLHLKGLSQLGAKIKIEEGYVKAEAKRLRGCQIYLGGSFGSSVLATANVMMAATLSEGKTTIESAACEPEITDLAKFLNKMGAKITGFGTPLIEIEGTRSLKGVEHTIIGDRIEAGTFMVAGGITRGSIKITGADPSHLGAVIDKLKEAGLYITQKDSDILVRFQGDAKPTNVTTLPYPGFPTDMQAQMMALLSVIPGVSVITEKVYPDRFMHVAELNRMGAKIQREGPYAIVEGVKDLFGAQVMASDLRASACLVLAGLRAKGKTQVHRIYHLERGYEYLEKKLEKLGARIRRIKE
jgi:UDP-N-acetylglucosamine 1-carboxyvinyltransferase